MLKKSLVNGFQVIGDVQLGLSYISMTSAGYFFADSIFRIESDRKTNVKLDRKEIFQMNNDPLPKLDDFPRLINQGAKSQPYPDFLDEKTLKEFSKTATNTRKTIEIILEKYGKLKERFVLH